MLSKGSVINDESSHLRTNKMWYMAGFFLFKKVLSHGDVNIFNKVLKKLAMQWYVCSLIIGFYQSVNISLVHVTQISIRKS